MFETSGLVITSSTCVCTNGRDMKTTNILRSLLREQKESLTYMLQLQCKDYLTIGSSQLADSGPPLEYKEARFVDPLSNQKNFAYETGNTRCTDVQPLPFLLEPDVLNPNLQQQLTSFRPKKTSQLTSPSR